MPAVAKYLRASAILFGLICACWLALPILNVLAGTYEGGLMLITCWLFAIMFGLGGTGLYCCYRFSRSGKCGPGARMLLWSFVVVSGVIASALLLGYFWSFILNLRGTA
jgi:hypothetical protein